MKKFTYGNIFATRRVFEIANSDPRFSRFVEGCLSRYAVGDWGDVHPDDWAANDEALKTGERILGSYRIPDMFYVEYEELLWIITEADRSVTTILFPGDY